MLWTGVLLSTIDNVGVRGEITELSGGLNHKKKCLKSVLKENGKQEN